MKKMLTNEKGFSLIELMIVVAIIGILSAIAVPNFQRFQAKSRQSEAKGNLAGYYQAAKASFAEQGYYPGDFVAIGFNPDGNLNYRIKGFNGTNPLPAGAPQDGTCINTSVDCSWTENYTENTATTSTGPVAGTAGSGNDVSFTAYASGRIGNTAVDEWSMTQTKTLAIVSDGLP